MQGTGRRNHNSTQVRTNNIITLRSLIVPLAAAMCSCHSYLISTWPRSNLRRPHSQRNLERKGNDDIRNNLFAERAVSLRQCFLRAIAAFACGHRPGVVKCLHLAWLDHRIFTIIICTFCRRRHHNHHSMLNKTPFDGLWIFALCGPPCKKARLKYEKIRSAKNGRQEDG